MVYWVKIKGKGLIGGGWDFGMNRLKKLLIEKNYILLCYIFVFFMGHVLMADHFPFVHSDEPWLSGLTRNMLQSGSMGVTETFFDTYPRKPHAIKVIFHIMQMPFLKLMGYSIFSFRMLSIIFGAFSIYAFYRACRLVTGDRILAVFVAALMGADIQFTYASGFARQEIVIVAIQICLLYVYFRSLEKSEERRLRMHVVGGLICGMGAGIHPNSFILAVSMGILYTYDVMAKRLRISQMLAFISATGAAASIFVVTSFILNMNFVSDYSAYGETLGAGDSIISKVAGIAPFYSKLYEMRSGTYYTPDIRFHFVAFILIFALSLLAVALKSENSPQISRLVLMAVGINIGYVIIGRYNQTSIVLIFPVMYLMLAVLLKLAKNSLRAGKPAVSFVVSVLLALQIVHSYGQVMPYMEYSYGDYIQEIGTAIEPDSMTFGNLNAEYFFENGKLLDYRNLYYAKKDGISVQEYMESRGIEYIIYLEELDYISQTSPMWDAFYGDPGYYHEELKDFVETRCALVHSFTDRTYGSRIAEYVGENNWQVWIYKVK